MRLSFAEKSFKQLKSFSFLKKPKKVPKKNLWLLFKHLTSQFAKCFQLTTAEKAIKFLFRQITPLKPLFIEDVKNLYFEETTHKIQAPGTFITKKFRAINLIFFLLR